MITTTVCTGDTILDAAFRVELWDQGGGAFIKITDRQSGHVVAINPDEWDELKECVEYLLKVIGGRGGLI